MRKTYATLASIAWLSMSAACTSAPPPAKPDAKPDADPIAIAPTCGTEMNVHGKGYDSDARSCLWDAYQNGKEASFVITFHTIEGDPIKYLINVHNKDDIDVTIDSRDRFGAQGVHHTKCSSLTKLQTTQERFGFTFRGCDKEPTERVIR